MSLAEFEPAISASQQLLTHALDQVTTAISLSGIQLAQNTVQDSVVWRHCEKA